MHSQRIKVISPSLSNHSYQISYHQGVEKLQILYYIGQNANRSFFQSANRNQTNIREICHKSRHLHFGVVHPHLIWDMKF